MSRDMVGQVQAWGFMGTRTCQSEIFLVGQLMILLDSPQQYI